MNLSHADQSYKNTPITAQKIKFSVKYLVTLTEEILNGKLHFLCSEYTNVMITLAFKYPICEKCPGIPASPMVFL